MRCFLLAGLACLAAGCSGGETLTTFSGKVTFTDGSPLTKGVVLISNDDGSWKGFIGADGTYTIEEAKSGDYLVAITGAYEGDVGGGEEDSMKYDEDGNYIETETPAEPKSLIATKYSIAAESGLKLKVPSDNYDLKVEKP